MSALILTALIPLIGLIALGYILKKYEFVDEFFWKGAEKINYYLFFPIMLFLNLATAEISINSIHNILIVLFAFVIVITFALYSLKKVYDLPTHRFGVYMQAIARFNSYIGLAVVASLFKEKGMTIFAIVLVFGIPLVNILSVLALTNVEQMKFSKVIVAILKNPLILGCIFGGIYNLTGLEIWTGAENFLKQLGMCSLPLGLMCVGSALRFKGLGNDFLPISLNVLGRMIIVPTLGFFICRLLDIPKLETQILILFFALPTASASYILTKVLGGDSRLMASIISFQTVFAIISLPFVLYLII